MRPYRGLTKEGKWVYGWYQLTDPSTPDKVKHYIIDCCGVTSTALVLAHNISDLPGYYEVIPKTVGQQIGLKDKNGKDLDWWEGDIFRFAGSVMPRTLVFSQGRFVFQLGKPPNVIECACKDVLEWGELPIKIGNVHQHPKGNQDNDPENSR